MITKAIGVFLLGTLVGRYVWVLFDWRSGDATADPRRVVRSAILWSASLGPGTVPELCARVGFRPRPMYGLIRLMERDGLLVSRRVYDERTADRGGRPRYVYSLGPLAVKRPAKPRPTKPPPPRPSR